MSIQRNLVFNFKLQYCEDFDCDNCGYTETETDKSLGPVISIPKQMLEQTFHESYFELMQPRCYICHQLFLLEKYYQ